MNITPYKHQRELAELNPDRHALVHEPGTGKTYASLMLAEQKNHDVLVICPKGLVQKWENDLVEYGFPSGIKVHLISKEQFKIHVHELPRYSTVIVDEAHYFFGTKSGLMKSLRWYFDKHGVECRYLLTGTPYRSTPMDIYIMCALLGKKLHYYEFQNKFFYSIRMGSRMIPQIKKNIENDVAAVVVGVGSIVKLDECVDMPPEIFAEDVVAPTKEQKDAIENMDGILPVTRYTAEHQITGGTLKGNEYEQTSFYASNKLAKLKERLEGIDRCIVVCRYNNEIAYLADELKSSGKRIAVIQGSTDDREGLLAELGNEERYVLLVNAKISEGWELTSCSHMIFYSYDFELKNYTQMFGRLRRINEPRPAMYISIMVKDTVDEAVFRSLKNKEDFHIAIYARSRGVV